MEMTLEQYRERALEQYVAEPTHHDVEPFYLRIYMRTHGMDLDDFVAKLHTHGCPPMEASTVLLVLDDCLRVANKSRCPACGHNFKLYPDQSGR